MPIIKLNKQIRARDGKNKNANEKMLQPKPSNAFLL